MKKTRRCGLGTTVCRGLLYVLLIVCFYVAPKSYAKGGDISSVNFNANVFSIWETGELDDNNGLNVEHIRRIRTKEYYSLDYNCYEVRMSSSDYTLTAFYYDEDMSFVSFEKVRDGSIIQKKATAKYVRFVLKKNEGEKSMSLGQFGHVFGSSLVISFDAKNYSVYGNQAESHELFKTMVVSSSNGWIQAGMNNTTGEVYEYRRRLVTKEFYPIYKQTITISFNEDGYMVEVYEFDKNEKFIKMTDVSNNGKVTVSDDARYVRFCLHRILNEKALSLGQWNGLFMGGLRFSILADEYADAAGYHGSQDSNKESDSEVDSEPKPDTVQIGNESTESYELFEGLKVSYSDGWIQAGMNNTTGEVYEYRRRLVTKEFYPIYKQTITISFNEDGYMVEVYEFDKNEKFIKMTDVSNNEKLTVTDDTRYVRFCLHRILNEKALSLGQWNGLFINGLRVEILPDDKKDSFEETYLPDLGSAPVLSPHDAVYNELKNMLVTGDRSLHDISQYGLDIYEIRAIEKELREGECYYYFANSATMFLSDFSLKNNICYTMRLEGMDADFLNRYNRMMKALDEVKSMTSSQMSDLDKAILAHEYIVQHSYYEKTSSVRGCTGGVLGDGHGLCAGYAHAFCDVMKYLGIETKYVSSTNMNHAWNLVKIDGQYYHVDCTWDNTIEESNGYLGHNYLLASDTRIAKNIPGRHYSWSIVENDVIGGIKVPAESTKFDNWFVHDVKGLMVYNNGFWYYADGDKIMKSDAYGKNKSTVLTETANVSIISLSQGKIQYKVNGVVKSIGIK